MELNMLRKALWVFLKPLITLITNLLNPEIGEEVLVELKKFNRKEPCWVKAVEEKLFNPHTYFTTRGGLWVSDDFTNHVLQCTTMPHRGLDGVRRYNLARDMTDQQIIDEILGGVDEVRKYAFTLDQIAAMIDRQPNGKDGKLLNNGYANIFYASVDGILFAAAVYWLSDSCMWNVYSWRLGEYDEWLAGGRVFRNTTLTL